MDYRVGFLRISADEVACEGPGLELYLRSHGYGQGSKQDSWVWIFTLAFMTSTNFLDFRYPSIVH
jgi:hypothetical protein